MSPEHGKVSMADESLSSNILGVCNVDLELKGETYHSVKLKVLQSLCSDVILGHDFLRKYSGLEMDFRGEKPPLKICSLGVVKVSPSFLFKNLTPDCRPVANKSRLYPLSDKKFIEAEIERMISEGIVRPSNSPWRAQVLVTSGENQKRRMVVDYSRTINRFTELDAYPLPNIDEIVNNITQYKVAIREEERPYTAFEAGGTLYEFNHIPFGVKNGVAAFQRVLDEILRKEKVGGTFAYVDNVTVCGETEEEHDQNLRRFLKVAEEYNLTLNHSRCDFKVRTIKLLGYSVTDGEIKPDSERLQPLWNLSPPKDAASLRMTMGLLAHYSRWIPNFSEKNHPLTQANGFPLSTLFLLWKWTPQEQRTYQLMLSPASVLPLLLINSENFMKSYVTQEYLDKLIKATQPFERLNLDFKGPVPSQCGNKYILTVVDEFSRFPFVFPCADMTTRTVIICTPHECLFLHSRRSTTGQSLPTWLIQGGRALLRRHVRHSKNYPLVDEVEIVEANPEYAHVKLSDGRATTVSLRHLAPMATDNRESTDAGDPVPQSEVPEELSVTNAPQEIACGISHVDTAPQNDTLHDSRTVPQQVASPPPLRSRLILAALGIKGKENDNINKASLQLQEVKHTATASSSGKQQHKSNSNA
ncbi:uncharacterized protein [Palaemon carinicauda]|uniref:uncharacterized protein n=1 Tax=Palaemon carinicauda TaxID=392227 RepID=UPI0035B692A2